MAAYAVKHLPSCRQSCNRHEHFDPAAIVGLVSVLVLVAVAITAVILAVGMALAISIQRHHVAGITRSTLQAQSMVSRLYIYRLQFGPKYKCLAAAA